MTHEYNKQSKEFREYYPRWVLVEDVVKSRVKEKGSLYIPKPNPDDTSERNNLAYKNYLSRTLFYNFTKPTQVTLLGSMFRKKPTIEVVGIDYILTDIDGSGLTLEGQAKEAARELTETSRGGFFVDYTSPIAAMNRGQEKAENMRPVNIFYCAKSIISWKTSVINSVKVLSKVVLAEYEDETATQHDRERVIYLDDAGNCQIDVYHYESGELKSIDETTPTNSAGKPLKYVPFQFVGGLNNDETVDDAILYDMATLNIAHLQSSADYEDTRYRLGQIQAFISGATKSEIDMNGGVLQYGSGVAWVFGPGADAKLLQAQPNSTNFESMQHKEAQAKAIGAKLQNPDSKQMTAREAGIISNSESASIVTIIDNLESAYRSVFDMMLDRVQSGSVEITFSREFVGDDILPEEFKVLGDLVFRGIIPDVVLFERVKESGYVSDEMTIDEWRQLIADNPTGLNNAGF